MALCQPINQCRAMPAENSVLFPAAKLVLCPVAAGSFASPEFRTFGKVQTSWPQLPSVYRLAWQHIALCVLMALVCALLASKPSVRATPAMIFGFLCYWLVPRKSQQVSQPVAKLLPHNRIRVKQIRITNGSNSVASLPRRRRRRRG